MKAPAPPEGAPWDLPIGEADFAFVDLEMTGLDVAKDHVIEVCVERVRRGAVVDRFVSLVKPEKNAGGAVHIHGISEADLEDAPPFLDLVPRIRAILEGAVFVAHGAKWDVAFLEAEMKRAGQDFSIPHYVDTLTLARRAFGLKSHSLDALCTHFGIDRGVAHRAEADVTALRDIFGRTLTTLEPANVRDLWEVRVGGEGVRHMVVEALNEALSSGRETTIQYRPSGKSPQNLKMVITEIRSNMDPPRAIGYLVPGRSRRELRVDRILHVEPATPQ